MYESSFCLNKYRNRPNVDEMKVYQVRDSVNCRADEVRHFVKIVDVVRVDQVRVDQVRVDQVGCSWPKLGVKHKLVHC